MTPRTISDLEATRDLIRVVLVRVIRHTDDFKNEDALTALTTAQRELEHVGRLLQQVPTIEDCRMVMRESMRLVESRKCEEVSKS